MPRRRLHAVEPAAAPAAATGSAPAADASLTIDELGRASGMTVRTIRSHQARGLLPPPEVRQRTGYYGQEHLARLRLIAELQADGFNLKGIARLLEEEAGRPERLLGLKRVATAPFESEEHETTTLEELGQRFGEHATPAALAKAEKLGTLVALGDGRYDVPAPSLLDAAEQVVRHGVPLAAALSVLESLQRQSETVARRFVKLFMEHVWQPFDRAGSPEEQWPEVIESIEHLRPLASQAMLAVFQATMTREVESAFGRELARRAKRSG